MNKQNTKVLVLGPGPVVVGRSSEYDYACVQALCALREDGVKTVLVNSNPASVMVEQGLADSVYLEPLEAERLKKIIQIEQPGAILSTFGGETALELTLTLVRSGFLEEHQVEIMGIHPEILHSVQDREAFANMLQKVGEPGVRSLVVANARRAGEFAQEIGYPVLVSPAYTLGGRDKRVCYNSDQLADAAAEALEVSRIHQILVEKCIAGWKEIEFEVMRDCAGNCMSVCSMENVDPVGINAGDSVIVAPAQTLTDAEAVQLRSSAINIVSHLGVQGVCNVRFALKPDGSEYAVLEADPRAGRSSALAAKATGYPIALVSTKAALGYRLDEMKNPVTGVTTAFNEPAVDYCAVRLPKWSFGGGEGSKLGTSMKATGEAMAVGASFELAFMKAVRAIDPAMETPSLVKLRTMENSKLLEAIKASNHERIFAVYEAVYREIDHQLLHELTMIDLWFLAKLGNIAQMERALRARLDESLCRQAKQMGFTDRAIAAVSGQPLPCALQAAYKAVDSCAAEFDAAAPYYYSTFDGENELDAPRKKAALVIGAGAVTVGSGAELDCCAVAGIQELQAQGYYTVVLNNSPGAVSTDYLSSDLLLIDPVTEEDVVNLVRRVRPEVALVQYGGKYAFDICAVLKANGVRILGADEVLYQKTADVERFYAYLDTLDIPHTPIIRVRDCAQAFDAAKQIGYPVLLQGGGQSVLAYNSAEIAAHFEHIKAAGGEETVPVRGYYIGTGIDMDVLCDGAQYFIPGISEQVERAGIHSGDAISVYPAVTLTPKMQQCAAQLAGKLALELGVKGMLNVRFVQYDNKVYLTRASVSNWRNVAYITRATGVPVAKLAVRCMLGESIASMGYGTGVYAGHGIYAVRVPVFSFDRVSGLDTQLGLEMKSTGEAVGIANTFEDALLKGLVASGMRIKHAGAVFITVRDSDKQEAVRLADQFSQLGFDIYATSGTARILNANCVAANAVRKIHEGSPNTLDLLDGNKIVYVISTSAKGRRPLEDDVKIRRRAVERQIPTFTSLDTAGALVNCLKRKRSLEDTPLVDIHTIGRA